MDDPGMIAGHTSASGTARAAPDFESFAAIAYQPALAVARALTNRSSDAEDIVQESLIAAHRHWTRMSTYDDPMAWLRRVVTNRCTSRWRRLSRETLAISRLTTRVGANGHDDPPLPDAALWAAVRTLPRQQARAVVLYYVDDQAIDDVARTLGCSSGAVKSHLSRARATLARTFPDARVTEDQQ